MPYESSVSQIDPTDAGHTPCAGNLQKLQMSSGGLSVCFLGPRAHSGKILSVHLSFAGV